MDVVVSGSSGFIGSALLPALDAAGHRPVRLVRRPGVPDSLRWDPEAGTIDAAGLEGVGAVVHLAAEGIGQRRWTAEQKRRILDSRAQGTSLLAETLANLERPPPVFLSASAVGYYGDRGDEILTEASPPGTGFLPEVCVRWEDATAQAPDVGIRTVLLRSGVVLHPSGGTLERMLAPFKLGLGGRVASGRQYVSWISLTDEVRAMLHVLETPSLAGPVNLTAPNPVTMGELVKSLGAVLRRPTVLPTPLVLLKLRYGSELVRMLLVEGQRVRPEALLTSGFRFEHETIEEALRAVLGRPARAE